MTWAKFPRFRKEQNQWDNPEASTGIFIRSLGKNVCHEAIGPAREIFDQQLGKEIKAILDGCGNPLQQTVTWSIYMIGRTRGNTAPKVIFSCTDEAARKEVRKTIKDSSILRRYPGIGTGDSSLPPDFNTLIQQLAIADIECASEYGSVAENAVLCITSDITFGKQIFIKDYNGVSQTLRRATAGGIVRFKDESYYLTVAHAFERRENILSADLEDCPFEIDFDGQSDADDDYGEDVDVESTSRGSLTPEDARTEGGFSSDDGSDVSTQMDDTAHSHDLHIHVPDLPSTNDRLISLTPSSTTEQPSDTPIFLELVGDLALTSSDDPNSSLDVALIKLHDQTAYIVNEIPLGSNPGAPCLYSERIAKIELEDAEIVTVTASGGLLRGRLSATPTYMRLSHSKNFQKVYTVRLDSTIVDGDCGSLVINHANGDLYGHIIAGSSGTGTVYIIPATQVFEDLEQRLGGAVSLPTRDGLPSLCQQDTFSSPIVSEISGPDNHGVGAQSYNRRDASVDPEPAEGDCEKQGDLDSDDNPWNKDSDLEDESQLRHSLPRTKSSGSPEDASLPIVARGQSPPTSTSSMPPSGFPHYLVASHDGKSFQGVPRELPYDQTALPFENHIKVFVHEYPSFYLDTPPENFQSEMHRSASLNGSLKPSSHYSSELPLSNLSSASGYSISSASSSAVGSLYSGHAHSFSHQESWINPTEGLGLSPLLVNQDAYYHGFVGTDLDSELAFGSRDKLPDDFLDPSLIPASRSAEFDGDGNQKGRCPNPDCGRVFKDLKAHMLTHQSERPEKCLILNCEYNQKGFARKYDKNRHTLTHYKGTMVCGFCPGSGSAAEKSFNRADVFKRHLTFVHGVEQSAPNSRKRSPTTSIRRLTSYCEDATGKCSTCSATFTNAQEFYEHLDDCVLRVAQQEGPSEAYNQRHLATVTNGDDVKKTMEQHVLGSVDESAMTVDEDFEEEEDDDEKDGDEDEDNPLLAGRLGKGSVKASKAATGVRTVISSRVSKPGRAGCKGLTYSKGGIPIVSKGRKKRKHYPSSWGMPAEEMQMKKRVLCVYDGQRRLSKDDMMMHDEFEVRMKLADGKSYVTDLDVETLNRAEALHSVTEAEKGPWPQDESSGFDQDKLDQLMSF